MKTNDDGKFCMHTLDSHDIIFKIKSKLFDWNLSELGLKLKNYKDEIIVIEIKNNK